MFELTDEDVASLARAASGEASPVVGWDVVPTSLRVQNMTTASLQRLRGTLSNGASFSVFIKTLHPASSSPMWEQIPEMFHSSVLEDLNWLDEPRVYRSALRHGLPEGLRMPELFRIDETPSTISMFLEDLPDRPTWDLDRYRRSARALGRLAGRWPGDRAADELAAPRRPIARLFFGKIVNFDLQIMGTDAFWDSPAVAQVADPAYRADLGRLAATMPQLLARLDELPHALAHGDAAPDNLREPADGTIAAIDWSYASIAPIGSDLGQLVSGRVDIEDRGLDATAALLDVLIDEYVGGLDDEGVPAPREDVQRACVTYLAVRYVFSALVPDPQAGAGDDDDRLRRRAALARLGLDLCLDLAASC